MPGAKKSEHAMVKVIGVDPGLASTGVAVVEGRDIDVSRYSFGLISTKAGQLLPERLNHIFRLLKNTLEEETPDLLVVEDVFSYPGYPKSGIRLGNVTGVIFLASFQTSTPVMEVSVRETKSVLTGSGSADKKQLEACVRSRLNHPEPIRPDHVSDALALALVGLYRIGGRWEKA